MKRKLLFLTLVITNLYIYEKIITLNIMEKIKKNNFFISKIILENRSIIENKNSLNKSSIFCESKSSWAYSYALCFRFPITSDNTARYILQNDDIINYDFIPPRPILSFSRIFWQNNSYLNYKSPIGIPAGFVYGDGTWAILDFSKGENDKRKKYNPSISGTSLYVIDKTGSWKK